MTLYEIFDKNTGEAILKNGGAPLRTDFMSLAAVVIGAIKDKENVLYLGLHDFCQIPDGANLDIRPVSSDTDADTDTAATRAVWAAACSAAGDTDADTDADADADADAERLP